MSKTILLALLGFGLLFSPAMAFAGGKPEGASCHVGKSCRSGVCITLHPTDKFGVCCAPKSCASLQAQCGSVDNGCGVPIECGPCDLDSSCVDNQCVTDSTTTSTTSTTTSTSTSTTSTSTTSTSSTSTSTTTSSSTTTTNTDTTTTTTTLPCDSIALGEATGCGGGCFTFTRVDTCTNVCAFPSFNFNCFSDQGCTDWGLAGYACIHLDTNGGLPGSCVPVCN